MVRGAPGLIASIDVSTNKSWRDASKDIVKARGWGPAIADEGVLDIANRIHSHEIVKIAKREDFGDLLSFRLSKEVQVASKEDGAAFAETSSQVDEAALCVLDQLFTRTSVVVIAYGYTPMGRGHDDFHRTSRLLKASPVHDPITPAIIVAAQQESVLLDRNPALGIKYNGNASTSILSERVLGGQESEQVITLATLLQCHKVRGLSPQ